MTTSTTPPLLAYYGDDFTGSADVMEVLQWFGMRTVLFLSPPTPSQLAAFEGLRAFGIAGGSRALSVDEMSGELPAVFRRLRDSGAPIVHYKTCSTFDSSPEIGSIGRAIELGRGVFGDVPVPVVIAAPPLGRYQVFGNLFARSGLDSEPYRLDRHPTMRQHPITPMTEADLRVVLSQQSQLKTELIDLLALSTATVDQLANRVAATDAAAVLFDVLDEGHSAKVGAVLDCLVARSQSRFIVGSSGVETALTAAWSRSGRALPLRTHAQGRPVFRGVERLLVITGSCSPVNDRQIACAERHGFCPLAIGTPRLVDEHDREDEIQRVVAAAIEQIDAGRNVIVHSSRGPHDPRVAESREAMRRRGLNELAMKLRCGRVLGPPLGRILKAILSARPFPRVGVAGGDTSGYVARELELTALEAIAPVAPGSPLCRAHAPNALEGTEFLFKGGQVGRDDVWLTMLHGTAGLPGTAGVTHPLAGG
jgi:uncharacterized protein YgbK (DUF1537 family)